jgi:hypothetical protein
MTSSSSLPPLVPARPVPRLTWSFRTGARPAGLVLARERKHFLAWDNNAWLYILNAFGEPQSQRKMTAALRGACCADDGSAYAAVGAQGEVSWLAPDLTPRWEQSLRRPALAAALDPFGRYLAVAEAEGRLYLFNAEGGLVSRAKSPRPLHCLAFIPEAPLLVGCADYGLVTCFNLAGDCVWRDGLVAHIGSLAVSGDGERIVLACYSDGLRCYSASGAKLGQLALKEPCYLATVTFTGERLLAVDLGAQLYALDRDGRTLSTLALESPVVSVVLGALGKEGAVALADRRILGLDLRDALGR